MVAGTSLETLCNMASGVEEFKKEVQRLFSMEFTQNQIAERESMLQQSFSNQNNCTLLKDILILR
jgi:hypothetical protein